MAESAVRYPPIGDYGVIGDLRSAALVSRQGSIDWLCLPRFDSPWIFGRILDWNTGGFLQLEPVGGTVMYRQYRKDSNVLETTWSVGRARVRVVDFMPIPRSSRTEPLAESVRLMRMLQPVAGTTDWRLTFKPRADYGRRSVEVRRARLGMLQAELPEGMLYLEYPDDAQVEVGDGMATVTGQTMPGHRCGFVLHYSERRRPPVATTLDQVHSLLHQTDDYWVNWLAESRYHGRFEDALHRSALALKLMQCFETGAFVAAPTSSLPESLGGSLNWDYRYTWIRDTSDLVNALNQMGFHNEADGFLRWVRGVHNRHPRHFQVMYRIDGDDDLAEYVVDELDGYRGSRPVRIGNAAVEQLQLDIYGELLQTAYTAWSARKEFPRPRRAVCLQVIDYILAHWEQEDSGIWESRRRPQRYLYSQVLLWVGLDRALRMDRGLRMGKERARDARRTRDAIKRQVLARGYNRKVGAFTQALDSDVLDATALAVPMYGLLPATDPRVVSTVKVLQERLSENGFLYRYVAEQSEFGQPEGVFILCTLWLVNVLAQMGRRDEAETLFSRVTETANDLGLYAEEFDPRTREMLGNFPQALTHLSVINAIFNLEGRPSGKSRQSGRRAPPPTRNVPRRRAVSKKPAG